MDTDQQRPDPLRAGTVTRIDGVWAGREAADGVPVKKARTLWWFGGAAAVIIATGIVVLLVLVFTGEANPMRRRYAPPAADLPPLAKLCPPPTAAPGPTAPTAPPAAPTAPPAAPTGPPAGPTAPPAAPTGPPAGPTAPPAAPPPGSTGPSAGPRTVDNAAGISYHKYGEPWQDWRDYWAAGTLEIAYGVGQHFITEPRYNGRSDYHASILSGRVPAGVNDGISIDLACTGRQVAADVRTEYYPQPNRMELLRDEQTVLGGRPAWVTKFRLHFSAPGLRATSELAAVALIDVGRPDAAVLYISIPNTHGEHDWVADDALASVRTTP